MEVTLTLTEEEFDHLRETLGFASLLAEKELERPKSEQSICAYLNGPSVKINAASWARRLGAYRKAALR
jgi:hypothetical protein